MKITIQITDDMLVVLKIEDVENEPIQTVVYPGDVLEFNSDHNDHIYARLNRDNEEKEIARENW
jgi:hypothetical protein